MRVAGIDIGSNTILMVIAELEDGVIKNIISDHHSIARLGENLKKTGTIIPDALDRAKKILGQYNEICKQHKVDKINAVATAALRNAANQKQVLRTLEEALAAKIEVIDGFTEAQYSFLGTVLSPVRSLVIDIGGGSTEVVVGEGDKILSSISLEIGAVKLTEMFFTELPPKENEVAKCSEHIDNLLSNINLCEDIKYFFAVAGTATTMASVTQNLKEFNYYKVHKSILNSNDITICLNKFLNADLITLIEEYHIPEKRADVITAGALILERFVKYFNIPQMIVSAHGLRYGVLHKK